MMRHRLVLALCFWACHPAAGPRRAATPTSGISIALYDTFALVDDRRSIEVRGSSVELEHIDPGAALATLVMEPLDPTHALHIGACTRDALPEPAPEAPAKGAGEPTIALQPVPPDDENARNIILARRHLGFENRRVTSEPAPAQAPQPGHYAPVVRCEVTAAPGRYLVRILYVSSALRYRAEHTVTVTTADRATVVSRFAIETPSWGQHAELVVYDGLPGGAHPPRELARGPAVLDGSIAILATSPRDVAAQLQRVYMGVGRVGPTSSDQDNSSDTVGEPVPDVWVRLELADVRLPAGPVHVHVEVPGEVTRDCDVGMEARDQGDHADVPLRLPLWIDPTLRGFHQRSPDYAEGASIAERFLITVANLGDSPREVWVEEPLRHHPHYALERAWPGKPAIAGDRVRAKLLVAPGKLDRVGFTATYRD
jgi:hypothetical protein